MEEPFTPTTPVVAQRDKQEVITVRMPADLHKRLKSSAHKAETSMNKLVVDMMEHCLKTMKEENNG